MEHTFLTGLKERIRSRVDYNGSLSNEEFGELIESVVLNEAKQRRLTVKQRQELVYRLYHSFRGLDVLQPLLDDRTVTEIMVNNHDEIFAERAGVAFRTEFTFESKEKLEDIIQAIVSKVNRIVNESSPIVDARLPDGSRVHVVLPPIAIKGPTLTIRKFPERPLTMAELVKWGALTEEAEDVLKQLVRAKFNIFISGGTGSGKTTFLNALAQFIPEEERVITVEDSAELQLKPIPNWVALETRNANSEGKGEIAIRDLIRASLRMRPDRIIVGEVRGGEAIDMLQAMNTGHDGSMSTGHANTSRDMLSRLETMVLSAAPLPAAVIRKQIVSAIDVLVHLGRLRDGSRKVKEIHEVAGIRNGEIVLNPLFHFVESGELQEKVSGGLQATGSRLCRTDKLLSAGIAMPASVLGNDGGAAP